MADSGLPINDETLTAQIQPFLDEWYYRILHSPVGKKWTRARGLQLLLDVFGMIGINITAEQRLAASEDDSALIAVIIEVMPGEMRESFEATALQIQTVLHEATRILSASEAEGQEEVAALFDEAGSERGGLTQQVLKASVVHAAKEVSVLRRVHVSWRKNTDQRIDRLMASAEEAEHCQQQLMALESQLSELHGDSKAKNKGVLMSMAEGQTTALMHSVFSSWIGFVEKVHAEQGIRNRFQGQIDDNLKKIFVYKEAQIANIKNVLMRGVMEEKEVLLHMVWKIWTDEVNEHKAGGDTAAALNALQKKMADFESAHKAKAGQFMTRMASGNDASLTNLCLESWINYHQNYAQDREAEEKAKLAEQNFKKHMDEKKEQAQEVMNRMLAGSDQGLLSMVLHNWVSVIEETKKANELEAHLAEHGAKFKSLNGRQKAGAHGAQTRVNDQIASNLCQRVWNCWIMETKANKVDSKYTSKYETKKKQLLGVQNLFKSFAMQLEQNLGQDDDSSSRTERKSRKHREKGEKGMIKGADGTVSLPDINQKQVA